jgi:hypothetical protein
MSPSERKKLGKSGLTADEISAMTKVKSERHLQRMISSDLLRRGIYYIWQRTDKKATASKGMPDFVCCFEGRFVGIEVKFGDGIPSAAQDDAKHSIIRNRGDHHLVTTWGEYRAVLLRYGYIEKL